MNAELDYAREQRMRAAAPDLCKALREALESLEYVQRALPGAVGYGVRATRIATARALLAKVQA